MGLFVHLSPSRSSPTRKTMIPPSMSSHKLVGFPRFCAWCWQPSLLLHIPPSLKAHCRSDLIGDGSASAGVGSRPVSESAAPSAPQTGAYLVNVHYHTATIISEH